MGRVGLKRINRSYTKLNGLQPLTKTLSNGSISRALSTLQPLTLTMLSNSLKLGLRKTSLNGSTKGLPITLNKTLLDVLIKSNKSAGLKTSSKRGKAILLLNEDASGEYEDLSDGDTTGETIDDEESKLRDEQPGPVTAAAPENAYEVPNPQNFTDPGSQPPIETTVGSPPGKGYTDFASGTSNANAYGSSFLLSQSTGKTRKFNGGEVPMGSELLQTSDSGLSFKPRPNLLPPKHANVATTRQNALASSYQPNQLIFSNLQRTNTQYLKEQRVQAPLGPPIQLAAPNGRRTLGNTQSQLKKSTSNEIISHKPENRTQQRLWLQRENSMMDVVARGGGGGSGMAGIDASNIANFSSMSLNKLMFSHNYSSSNIKDNVFGGVGGLNLLSLAQTLSSVSPNESYVNSNAAANNGSVTNLLYILQSGYQNSIQLRTEFERLNREYVNARRHQNPVAASISRVKQYTHGEASLEAQKKNKKSTFKQSANSFAEFAPRSQDEEEAAMALVNKMWLQALIENATASSSEEPKVSPLKLSPQSKGYFGQNHENVKSQASMPARMPAPITRAVKLALAASGETQHFAQ